MNFCSRAQNFTGYIQRLCCVKLQFRNPTYIGKRNRLRNHGCRKWSVRSQCVRRQEQHLSSHQQGRILGRRDHIWVSLSSEPTAQLQLGGCIGWRTGHALLRSLVSDSLFRRCAERSPPSCPQVRVPGHTGAGPIKKAHSDAARNREM